MSIKKMEAVPSTTGDSPDYYAEYTAAIKQFLQKRREISQDLMELDEKFKELHSKTTDWAEDDEDLDKELGHLQDQVNEMKDMIKPHVAPEPVPTKKKKQF
eukprot:TRINITY_DN3565_c0_g1_i6.p2 TRINITY_DN3565_c0_g1~~TRINITY_DN3565_c0_g1_i6.p2  ORF type:complete len:101 (+),score=25.86 TRINITY_DN3565_c0_g1_i6:166-468(+)